MERNEPTQETNIIDLISKLDDYIIIKILLEMEPIQMTIFGATCWQFYRLTSDRKVWRQVIERQGLTEALLKRRGGKANLKRIVVMHKTYKSYLLEKENEIKRLQQEAEEAATFFPRLRKSVWMRLTDQFLKLYKDQNPCQHTTITYYKEFTKVKCPGCSNFTTVGDIFSFPEIEQYLRLTDELDSESFTVTYEPDE